jgi:D-alanine--poly(phosphoribitol) ligase subunit 1
VSAYPHNVAHLFRGVVKAHGNKAALVWSDRAATTFNDLDRLSDKVAKYLNAQGIRKGDCVGIRLDKCAIAYAIIIACLKIGVPYFAVDPSNPPARISHILDKCRPKILFSTEENMLDLANYKVVLVDPENQFAAIDGVDAGSFEPKADIVGTDPAYIMFTSGSTGSPKGAVMSHSNLLNFVPWARHEFSIIPDDVFTSVNPIYFDNSVFDFYASVMNGAAMAPFDAATMNDPYEVLRRINQLHCTIYFSVPSLLIYFQVLKMITPASFPHLRVVIFGGEGYPKAKLKELFDCLHPRSELVNVYGPTECTCICSAYRIGQADFENLDGYPPLGGPIPNFSFAILNDAGKAAAIGEVGELYLGGPSVGLGYFNDSELTQEAFGQNPLHADYHERVYRTGDLVSISKDDGEIYFVGRRDNQIKHHGYRIELEEIEHALRSIPGVDEAVALHATQSGISLIIAIVAASNGLQTDVIREQASKLLPHYMVPSRINVFKQLPKNANGKIDRRLLQSRYC